MSDRNNAARPAPFRETLSVDGMTNDKLPKFVLEKAKELGGQRVQQGTTPPAQWVVASSFTVSSDPSTHLTMVFAFSDKSAAQQMKSFVYQHMAGGTDAEGVRFSEVHFCPSSEFEKWKRQKADNKN